MRTWWVISGRASPMSLFIFRMTPICSSLFSSEYFSSLTTPPRLLWDDLYVSRLALERTTINLWVSLSLDAIGTCWWATSCGSSGGGHDWDNPNQITENQSRNQFLKAMELYLSSFLAYFLEQSWFSALKYAI